MLIKTLFILSVLCFHFDNLYANEALKQLTEQIKKEPKRANLFHRRANLHVTLKNYEQALSDIEKAIELRNDSPHYPKRRVSILIALNEFEKAEIEIKKLTKDTKENPDAFMCYSILDIPEVDSKILRQGLSYADKYLSSHKDETAPYIVKTLLYIHLNEKEKSLEVAKIGFQKFPEKSEILINLANAYTLSEDYEESKVLLKKGIARNPREAFALNHIAYQLITYNDTQHQRPEKALAFASQAYELSEKKIPDIIDTYALALFKNGKIKEAIDIQKKAIHHLTEELKKQNRLGHNQKLRGFQAQLETFEAELKNND